LLYLDFGLGFRAWIGVWVWWWLIWVDWWLGKDLVSLIGSDELSNVDDVSFDARQNVSNAVWVLWPGW
jgi:hypothetical protein